jgi:hypothetical protein
MAKAKETSQRKVLEKRTSQGGSYKTYRGQGK